MEIVIKDIIKTYDQKTVLNKLNFEIRSGQFFTLAGANGAGKSTLIDIILNRIEASSGTVLVNGNVVRDYHLFKDVGVVFQNNVLDKQLSVYQNVLIRAQMHYSRKEAYKHTQMWLDKLELLDVKRTRYGKLSGGERRKVDLVVSLIGSPKLLIMDEPTTGIDVQSREQIWNCINEIQQQQKMTILLTTHYLEEAEQSDYMIILNHGDIVASGTPYDLKQQYVRKECYLYTDNLEYLQQKLTNDGISCHIDKDKIVVYSNHNSECISMLKRYQNDYQDFEVILGSLEKAFMNIMKEDN